MKNRPLDLFVIALLLTLPFTRTYADEKSGTVSVIDLKGNSVAVPAQVRRIAVNGALAQMTLMLGCGDRIVATGPFITGNPMLLKVYPRIRDVPVVYGAPGGKSELNLEMLLNVGPDVVFGENAAAAALGIVTLAVSLQNFEDIKKTILMIGNVLGKEAQNRAIDFCDYYDSTITSLSGKTALLPDEKKPVVYYGGGDDGLATEGADAIASSWIGAAGGVNAAARHGIYGYRKVSIEEVMRWNPDVIIASSVNGYKTITTSPQWKGVAAVNSQRVYLSPKGVYLWSVRSAEGVLQIPWAAKNVHPELYEDIDMYKIVKDFYGRFYHYDISDGDIAAVLNAGLRR